MKIEKAIDILKEKLQISTTGLTVGELNDQKRALDLAIEALEKQMPKKFVYGKGILSKLGRCLKCKVVVENGLEEFNYCPDCGQKIDGSDEND